MKLYSINGVGQALYGKCDFDADGFFTTTKWLIFFYLPIIPNASVRLTTNNEIVEAIPICWRQVFRIYTYVYLLAPLLVYLSVQLGWTSTTGCVLFLMWVILPTLLRTMSMYRR